MKWGFFLVKTMIIYLILWGIFIYGYGEFSLIDSIVPERGVEIDEWLQSYYFAGGISSLIAFVCSCIWFYFGTQYAGGHGISIKFNILWIVTVMGGLISDFFIIMSAVDGRGLSWVFACLIAPIGYYIVSLSCSAEAVKFIPPLSERIHR